MSTASCHPWCALSIDHRWRSSAAHGEDKIRLESGNESEGYCKVRTSLHRILARIQQLSRESRLNVIKSVISEVNNAAKSSSPITSDVRLLAILRKKSALSRDAAKQFAEAKREDLQSKENAQADVLDEYASEVKLMGEEDVENAINEAIEKLKASTATLKPQDILKTLFGAGGAFDGKPVDRGLVAKKVSTLLKPQ